MSTPEDNARQIATHRLDRLRTLIDRLRAEIAGIDVSGPLAGDGLVATANVTLPNGYDLVLAVDHDVPDVFYEVARFADPGDEPKLPFEGAGLHGSALTDHLMLESVIQIVRNYALPPRRPSAPAGA